MNLKKKIAESRSFINVGDIESAKKILTKILRQQPLNSDANKIIAGLYLQRNDYEQTIDPLKRYLIQNPRDQIMQNNLGVCFLNTGKLDEALERFNVAISIDKFYADPVYNLGIVYSRKNDLISSADYYLKALNIDPAFSSAILNLISTYIRLEDFKSALKFLNEIFENHKNLLDPIFYQDRSFCFAKTGLIDDAINDLNYLIDNNLMLSESLSNRAGLYLQSGNLKNAITDVNKSIDINPNFSDAFNNRANIYKAMSLNDKALDDYNRAIDLSPNNPSFYSNRAILFRDMKRFDLAYKDATKNLLINTSPESYKLRADISYFRGDFDIAIQDYDQAINLAPNSYELYFNRGNIYKSIKKYKEAERDFSVVMPPNTEINDTQKYNIAFVYLHQKIFDTGWKFYNYRKKINPNEHIKTSKTPWDGKTSSTRIYITNEQGVGDQIFFSSLIPEFLNMNNKIILSVSPKLTDIYRRSFPEIEIFPVELEVETPKFLNENSYDYFIEMGDLPSLFRKNLSDFSKNIKPFLKVDKKKSDRFKDIFKNDKIVCGIAWKSKSKFGDFKSYSLENFAPLLQCKNIKFVNLQYGDVSYELDNIKNKLDVEIINFDTLDLFNDIDGLASLIEACDFVVTSSNVTSHIAGAIGKKTFLIAPFGLGKIWYWEQPDGQNIWYPSINVINHDTPESLDPPLQKVLKLICGEQNENN